MVLKTFYTVGDMGSQDPFTNPTMGNSSKREYMMYFTGMGVGRLREVELSELLDEMPYEQEQVIENVENLESEGYIETISDAIYPTETEGFNDILENTELPEVEETRYSLTGKGMEYLEKTGIKDLERSLEQVFR